MLPSMRARKSHRLLLPPFLGPSGAFSYAVGIVAKDLQLRIENRGSHPGAQVRTYINRCCKYMSLQAADFDETMTTAARQNGTKVWSSEGPPLC